MWNKFMIEFLFIINTLLVFWACGSKPFDPVEDPKDTVKTSEITCWKTDNEAKYLLLKQKDILLFDSEFNIFQNIEIDAGKSYQTIDGFGYTMTGGSARVLNNLNSDIRQQLLQELFGNSETSIGISFLRLSIGASDLNDFPFSYNDLPYGEIDTLLHKFSLSNDLNDVIPILKEIIEINPDIKFIATPWSAPPWMKDNKSFIGGSLLHKYFKVYADYFVKYIVAMALHGIKIESVTPQNEPLHPGNNPSMYMSASDQAKFIKNYLGPAFVNNKLSTKIIIYDHNCDKPEYPKSILDDPGASIFIDGTAFHLYAGDISILSYIHDLFPQKNLYFTEQYTASDGSFGNDLVWHLKNVIIGSMRNWSKIALEWNLANDADHKPHTEGGCSTCKGAITIKSKDSFMRNVGYYIIAHASKFVPPGSVRIFSSQSGSLYNVAFKTPDDRKVLITLNDSDKIAFFNIKYQQRWCTVSLDAYDVATYIWK
ncbi:MAG: glycoside hydrolase family 30 protein [Deltaproteobacteria bacterium]